MTGFNKVLICPQNWGLGHVTRTIPIIQYFLDKKYEVLLACSGEGSHLLRKEFPNLEVFEIADYNIKYPFKSMYLNIAFQFIKMNIAIVKEHFEIKRISKKYGIGLIVSDARLGAAQKKIPSIIIAHHLHFRLHFKLIEWICDTWLKIFYLLFDQLWIPDLEGPVNLSGTLSHLYHSKKHYFIGIVSRFQDLQLKMDYDYTFMLSGPEPQRSHLEEIILRQFEFVKNKKCILIRGTNQGNSIDYFTDKYQSILEVKNLVTGNELNKIMCASRLIICRSGYSTLLDLAIIRKPALLIPTPGQPEQEYLADELKQKGLFYSVSQDDLLLETDLEKAKDYKGYSVILNDLNLETRLDKLLSKL